MLKPHVASLHVYPVKGMRGIPLGRAELSPEGLRHDRRWMVVRADGRFVTQREEPRLALFATRLEAAGVRLAMEGHGTVLLPFAEPGGAALPVRVWRDDCEALDEGPEVSRWLTAALVSPEPLRIVRMASGFRRPQSQPERYGAETSTHFADSAPFLVTSEASLDALNRDLRARAVPPVTMDRFRPNIVVRGLQPFAEHGLEHIDGPAWSLSLVDPCQRCLVTTIDQRTARPDPAREPFMTLRRVNPAPGTRQSPAFGQNATLRHGNGHSVNVGDPLET
jgi:uncharacterized protein YcbX